MPPLRVTGLNPTGVRGSATQNWGVLAFNVVNQTDVPRLARVEVSFVERPDDHYSRELWAPPHATVSSWLMTGPAPVKAGRISSEIEVLLFDRTDGTDRLILPATEERIRSRLLLARPREPSVTVMLDEPVETSFVFGQLPQPPTREDEIYEFLLVFRAARGASRQVNFVHAGPLPPVPEAFEGVDHFVVTSNRIAKDPVGVRALRQWMHRGGHVWVMLDLVDPEIARQLLGDACDFEVVDRVSLTSTKLDTAGEEDLSVAQDHERPVDFVRVALPAHETVAYTVNGWPAWFSRDVGKGRVVFSTLGGRGWVRPRVGNEKSPFPDLPNLPAPLTPFLAMAEAVYPPEPLLAVRPETLEPLLTEEIGYAVVDRGWVVAVYALVFGGVLGVALAMRKLRRPELVGWLGPVAALIATVILFGVGEASRRAAAPTVAVAQIIHAVPGKPEATVEGLLALYRPDSGEAQFAAERGGLFELDLSGLEGHSRRFVVADMNAWRWEDLSLPAGLRFAPLRHNLALAEPMEAVARFGPAGLEGKVRLGNLEGPGDSLLRTPHGRNLAITIAPDGSFTAGSAQALPSAHFIAGAVLTDEQRRRAEVYRVLAPTDKPRQVRQPAVMTWTKPAELSFTLGANLVHKGSAVALVPLTIRRSAPGQSVHVPGAFVLCRRLVNQRETWVTTESSAGADLELRFQLPAETLPLEIQRARLTAKITAASRHVTVAARGPEGLVTLHRVESPLGPIEVDIDQPELLKLDAEGKVALRLSISDFLNSDGGGRVDGSAEVRWRIEYIELDVTGRTADRAEEKTDARQ